MNSLDKKVAIVTGASAGIGEATAEALAQAGACVVISGRRKEKLDVVAGRINSKGGRALAVKSDASKNADTDELIEKTVAWSKEVGGGGKIDIAVANAGRGLAGSLLTSDAAQWQEVYQVNVLGAAHFMRRMAIKMAEQKSGDIIAISSAVGQNVSPFSGFYGSSKWAITGMAEALRREVCAHGVRVTTVFPGIVRSEFQDVAGYTEENFWKGIKRIGKLIEPEDVARVIRFVVEQPAYVHINDVSVRPVGQDYP